MCDPAKSAYAFKDLGFKAEATREPEEVSQLPSTWHFAF